MGGNVEGCEDAMVPILLVVRGASDVQWRVGGDAGPGTLDDQIITSASTRPNPDASLKESDVTGLFLHIT